MTVLTLPYEARHLRRRVFEINGTRHLIDLAEPRAFSDGDHVETVDGVMLMIVAADEALLEITVGHHDENLARIAWHIGNRHTPCQVEADRLLIQNDHVLEGMLVQLGATIRHVTEPFQPEGGAYGHGRTHGHSHSHDAHADPNAHIPPRNIDSAHHHHHEHGHDHSHTPMDKAKTGHGHG